MPISYNVKSRDWYDTTASMVRHLGLEEDEAVLENRRIQNALIAPVVWRGSTR